MKVPARMSFEDCARNASAALRRAKKRPQQRAIFKAAEMSRLTLDWMAGVQPVDDELRWSLMLLRARARDLAKNNAYVRAYLRLLADNVIGPNGIKHQAVVRNNDDKLNVMLNDRIEQAFCEWSKDVTVGVPMTLTAYSRQTLSTVAGDGEVLVRLWRGYPNKFGFALESIDPDQIDEMLNRPRGRDGNEIRMGVEYNDAGRPVAYHVWNEPRFVIAMAPTRERIRIPAEDVIHLYHPDRINQSRGVTWLLPAMYALRMLDGYEEAELVNARVAASKMGFLVRKDETSGMAQTDPVTIEANPGTFETLPPGYELLTFDTQHPSQQFPNFVKTQLRKIASALGMSYNLLASDLEGVNYSSMRSGMLSDRDNWRGTQQWWLGAFQERIYAEWMNMALMTRALTLDNRQFEKLLAVAWTPRGWAWVDPMKDMEAGVLGIQNGLSSRTSLLAEQGLDFEDIVEEISNENEIAKEKGVEITVPQPAPAPATPKKSASEADPSAQSGNRLIGLLRNGGSRG